LVLLFQFLIKIPNPENPLFILFLKFYSKQNSPQIIAAHSENAMPEGSKSNRPALHSTNQKL